MKRRANAVTLLLASALLITLGACSSGGGDGGGGGITPPPTPYPDPSNPSEFPTRADTEEGSSGDDTPATAGTLSLGETTYHTIYPIGDVDWRVVTLTGGTQYEFTVDNVSYNGYPLLHLYASSDTSTPLSANYDTPGDEWGYFSNNPRILYTPAASGTYYLKVVDYAGGINSYTLSSRFFLGNDSDSDTFSTHYDCNDTSDTIYPWAPEGVDGTDQSCSGYSWPNETSSDSYEADDDFADAGNLPMLKGDPWDIIHRQEVYAKTHTIHANDTDTFLITVPAYSAYEIFEVESSGANLDSDVYESDQSTIYDATNAGAPIYHWLDNSVSATPSDFYLKVYATTPGNTAGYVLGVADAGTDADGDGYYTRSLGSGWDCDDGDDTINAGAAETASDSTDSNCNGEDDT